MWRFCIGFELNELLFIIIACVISLEINKKSTVSYLYRLESIHFFRTHLLRHLQVRKRIIKGKTGVFSVDFLSNLGRQWGRSPKCPPLLRYVPDSKQHHFEIIFSDYSLKDILTEFEWLWKSLIALPINDFKNKSESMIFKLTLLSLSLSTRS